MKQVFNDIPWIIPKESDEITKIYMKFGSTKFINKETIIKFPGEENKLFYIKKGLCFAYINTNNDMMLTIGVLPPGRAIGDMTVISGEKVNMTIIAKKNTQILTVRPHDYKNYITSDPKLSMLAAQTILAKRNCQMEGLIANLTLPLEDRLKTFFLASIISSGVTPCDDMIELPLKLSNEDLASITFSTRVSVSRVISKWVRMNLLIKENSHNKFVHKDLIMGIKDWHITK